MNDPNATQAQVADTLRDIAHGVAPLAVVTVAVILAWALAGQPDPGG